MTPLPNWRHPDRGVLFVITGPSGVGKSTLIRAAMARIPGLSFSVSATTRAARAGEVDGADYHFLTPEAFAAQREAGHFLEHATVYDRSYGTLQAPTEAALATGASLILDIDVQGAEQVRAKMPEAVLVFLIPPDAATLEARLRARGTDSEEVIASRMRQLDAQMQGCDHYDYIVMNDDLTTAHAVFQGVLLAELSRIERRSRWVRDIQSERRGF